MLQRTSKCHDAEPNGRCTHQHHPWVINRPPPVPGPRPTGHSCRMTVSRRHMGRCHKQVAALLGYHDSYSAAECPWMAGHSFAMTKQVPRGPSSSSLLSRARPPQASQISPLRGPRATGEESIGHAKEARREWIDTSDVGTPGTRVSLTGAATARHQSSSKMLDRESPLAGAR